MKSASIKFKNTMGERTDFYQTAHIVFTSGEEKDLKKSDFYISGNSYVDSAGGSSFPIGVALAKQITISIVNDVDQYSEYDFYLAKITVYCKLDLDDGTTEPILFGTFTVTEPESYGTIIEVNAVDDAYKGDKDYTPGIPYPATVGQILRDSCRQCNVTLLDTTFINDDYMVQSAPENITHRMLWGMCAMLAGGNARMDEYNRLTIKTYDLSVLDREGADGGWFDPDNPYSSGDNLDGGAFNPWNIGDTIDGGMFLEMDDYHVFWKAKNLTISTDDVVITGIQTTIENDTFFSEAINM